MNTFNTPSLIAQADYRGEPCRIAVIGAGVAGAACAAGLLRAGVDVTVFDKSRGVGGRMATRRTQWATADGISHAAEFDHGCPQFTATRPRFKAVVDRAEAIGCVSRVRQYVHAKFPAPRQREVVVPTPNMPAFCRHLLNGVPLHLGHAVTGLKRGSDGWRLQLAGGDFEGPFDQVVVAIPAPRAAALVTSHRPGWAGALIARRMSPCWTLMAVTDDVDWPWDAAEIDRGALGWIARNDRKPDRHGAPAGRAQWVAHATPEWSLAHLEDEPEQVDELLRAALSELLPGGRPVHWHFSAVHRWRHAQLAQPSSGGPDCWWSASLGLGVCGDSFASGSVEAAWCSGDELADTIAAALDVEPLDNAAPEPELAGSLL